MKNLIFLLILFVGSFSFAQIVKVDCGDTDPQYCVNDEVYYGSSKGKIVGISSDKKTYTVKYGRLDDVAYTKSVWELSKTIGCGKTTPKYCVNDEVYYGSSKGKIVGISSDKKTYTVKYGRLDDVAYMKRVDEISLISRPTTTLTVDRLDPRFSRNTEEIVDAIKQLQSAVSTPRRVFLEQMTSGLAKQSSEVVNIMAGLLTAKIVKGLTAQLIRDNFDKEVDRFLAEEKSKGFVELNNITIDRNTLDLASRVLFAAATLAETQLSIDKSSSLKHNIGLNISNEKLSTKLIQLQGLCEEARPLILALIENDKYSIFGQITADTCGWVLEQ